MERILISQIEDNDRTQYVVVDGLLLEDKSDYREYTDIVINAGDYKTIYKDSSISIKQRKQELIIYSHYLEKDSVGRSIMYIYYIDKNTNDFNNIIQSLLEDSKVINRNINKYHLQQVIEKLISKRRILNNNVFKIAIIAILAGVLIYTIFNNKKHDKKTTTSDSISR